MGNESSERIQTSILNKMEKKLLIWLAQRQPAWITSDFLTFIGVIGAVLFAIGGILAHRGTKLLQKSEMRKDIVIELSYKGFSCASDYS